jgi:hypothetical protein
MSRDSTPAKTNACTVPPKPGAGHPRWDPRRRCGRDRSRQTPRSQPRPCVKIVRVDSDHRTTPKTNRRPRPEPGPGTSGIPPRKNSRKIKNGKPDRSVAVDGRRGSCLGRRFTTAGSGGTAPCIRYSEVPATTPTPRPRRSTGRLPHRKTGPEIFPEIKFEIGKTDSQKTAARNPGPL